MSESEKKKIDSAERDDRDKTEGIGLEEDLELSDDQIGGIIGGLAGSGEEEEVQT